MAELGGVMVLTARRLGRLVVGPAAATTIDQGLSGLTNLLTVVAVSHRAPAEQFGYFSMVYSVAIVCLALVRTLLGEGNLISWGIVGEGDSRTWMLRGSIEGAAATIVLAALGGVLWPGVGVGTAILLGGGFGALVLQELLRYRAVQSGLGWRAVASELIWLTVLGSLWASTSGPWTVMVGLVVWLVPAAVSSLVLLPSRRQLRCAATASVVGRRRNLRLTAETALAMGATALPIAFAGFVIGPAAAGALRLAQSLLGPPSLLIDAARKRLTLQSARDADADVRRASRALLAIAALVGLVLVVGLRVVGPSSLPFVPAEIGEQWSFALIGLLVVAFVFRAAGAPSYVVLRRQDRTDTILHLRGAALVVSLIGLAGASVAGSTTAVAAGLALASVCANGGALIAIGRSGDNYLQA